MALEKIAFAGWSNCLRLTSAHAELILTTDVGPRILSARTRAGENMLWVNDADSGKSGEPDFQVRGGHRLWVSPEDDRSYAPDNGPVQVGAQDGLSVVLENPAAAPWRVRKALGVKLSGESASVEVEHRLTNEGSEPVTIASWALTVMAPGGFEIIPQPPLGRHALDGFLAERVVVPWKFTDFSDRRWRFGSKFWLLCPEAGTEATKIGLAHLPGWAAWTRPGALFIKRFAYEAGATYPDFGCNFETFTKGEFLELESLSPLRTLAPGQSVGHRESWHLFDAPSAPADLTDASLEGWLAPYLAQCGLA